MHDTLGDLGIKACGIGARHKACDTGARQDRRGDMRESRDHQALGSFYLDYVKCHYDPTTIHPSTHIPTKQLVCLRVCPSIRWHPLRRQVCAYMSACLLACLPALPA